MKTGLRAAYGLLAVHTSLHLTSFFVNFHYLVLCLRRVERNWQGTISIGNELEALQYECVGLSTSMQENPF
jgi:hypothetical protein